ncbi:MAG: hypothetical protein NC906_03540 [Candidatus Omnitrophica bacterium]|nr:hypothetical protein [Candidatus Omnitrophota bacterium]
MRNIVFLSGLLILCAGCFVSNNVSSKAIRNSPVVTEEESLYECYWLKEAPVIDGKMDDACWQNIPAARCFFLIGGNEFALVKPSVFKAGWDGENFYFGFMASEPETGKIISKRLDGDKFLWTEDSVELFLFPPDADAWQFIINAIGSRWNGRGDTGTTLPLQNWQAKSYIGNDSWSVEVKIPFGIFKKIPADGEKWKINVGRNNLTGPVEERVSCWPRIKKSFHEIDNFGTLVFKKDLLDARTAKIKEDMINLPRYNMLRKRIVDLADVYKNDYMKYLEKADAIPSLSAEAKHLKKIWITVIDYHEKIERDKQFNLEEMYGILLNTKGLREKTEELKQRVDLESLFD